MRAPAEVLKHFGVSESRGLSGERVKEQRAKFGPNCMIFPEQPSDQSASDEDVELIYTNHSIT